MSRKQNLHPRYAIGIDLGTTNCALSYVDLKASGKANRSGGMQSFQVPQWRDWGEVVEQDLLPSLCYLPIEDERIHLSPETWSAHHASGTIAGGKTAAKDKSASNVPADYQSFLTVSATEPARVVGVASKHLGAKTPSRLISSAKSWLCHAGVDRTAAILPPAADSTVQRMSPVEVSALYLRHLRLAWNAKFGTKGDDHLLDKQAIVLTVPASFDHTARELTVQAAKLAGIEHFTLIEEPLAAFYHWLARSGNQQLDVGTVCLVVDVGGGTTDFSLIGVVERDGNASYERLAVGDHLLLGGDNMDLALAHQLETILTPNRRLDPTQWSSLVQACRSAKEQMLSAKPPEQVAITVVGRGRSVIGGTLSTQLSREQALKIVLEGFFPRVDADAEVIRQRHTGLQEFGLAFEADPAVTRHLSEFLRRQLPAILKRSSGDAPDSATATASAEASTTTNHLAILFNGGVFNASQCQDRLLDVTRQWLAPEIGLSRLDCEQLDLAVAHGAAYFASLKAAESKSGKSEHLVRAGMSRSYYIGVARADEQLLADHVSVVCIAPKGLEPGNVIKLDALPLKAKINEPVRFPLYASNVRADRVGDFLQLKRDQLAELPSVSTVLRSGKKGASRVADVVLEAKLTELGILELQLADKTSPLNWKLQLETNVMRKSLVERHPAAASTGTLAVTETISSDELAPALIEITNTFSPVGKSDPQSLAKRLENAMAQGRDKWSVPLLRGLFDSAIDLALGAKRSVEHECRWLNLIGFLLRPGWGDPFDHYRAEQLWKVVHHGVHHPKEVRAWIEYAIMLRRAVGGLDKTRQLELYRRISPYLEPNVTGRKLPRRPSEHEIVELWRLAASLEGLDTEFKVTLGNRLVDQIERQEPQRYTFWALARVGNRQLFNGPANSVVPADVAERWLRRIMQSCNSQRAAAHADRRQRAESTHTATQPISESSQLLLERHELHFCVNRLALFTGDRTRDIDDDFRQQVVQFLQAGQADARLIVSVQERVSTSASDDAELFGEALPAGLILGS